MENECYSVWIEWGVPGIPEGQCGVEAGSVARRPWHGPLLLVGGCLAEGQRDLS